MLRPSPRELPVTKITLASSATMRSDDGDDEDDDLVINLGPVKARVVEATSAPTRTVVAERNFMVLLQDIH